MGLDFEKDREDTSSPPLLVNQEETLLGLLIVRFDSYRKWRVTYHRTVTDEIGVYFQRVEMPEAIKLHLLGFLPL